jgi:hypothetical protein
MFHLFVKSGLHDRCSGIRGIPWPSPGFHSIRSGSDSRPDSRAIYNHSTSIPDKRRSGRLHPVAGAHAEIGLDALVHEILEPAVEFIHNIIRPVFLAHHADRTFAVPARSECSTAGSEATGGQHRRRKIQEGESSLSIERHECSSSLR